MLSGPYLRVAGLTKSFARVPAVENLSLDIGRGELFAVLGPSGCGKTTLLRMLAGFEMPDAGRIQLDGADITQDAAAPPSRQHDVPELRAVPAYERGAERRLWPAPGEGAARRDP